MAKKYVHNDTAGPIWAGGKLIPAGEGREVDVPDEPSTTAAADADQPDPQDNLRELLDCKVADVVAALDGLGEDTLKALQALENASEKPRKGVLMALADKLIAIADEKLQSDDLDAPVPGTGEEAPAGGQ